MKKFLKFVLILSIILIITFLVNLIRNYLILKSIFSINNDSSNYYFEENSNIIANNITYKTCIYSKDDKYYIEVYENDKHIHNIWIDNINKEYILQDIEKNQTTREEYNDFYTNKYKFVYMNCHDLTISNLIIKKYLFTPIAEKDNEYVIKIYDDEKVFVDKESKFINKIVSKDSEINYKFNNTSPINLNINKPQIEDN